MPPKKPNRSPFGIFMSKMRRVDPKLRSMPFSESIRYCETLYRQLSPEVKSKIEKISVSVRTSPLNEEQLSRELDKLSLTVEDNNDWDDKPSAMASDPKQKPCLGFYSLIPEKKLQKQKTFDEEVDTFAILEQVLKNTEEFQKKSIIGICFNILVHTIDDQFIPNEIGLIKWSLEDGLQESFTKLIANEPPDGYYGSAKEFSERYHKIPVINKSNEEFEKNYRRLFDQIYDFMSASDLKTSDNRKLVVCKPEQSIELSDRPQVVGCLEWLDEQMIGETTKSLVNDFEVVELSDLLFQTTRKYCEIPRPRTLCVEHLTRSTYDYYEDMRCDFHAVDDNNYCALAAIKRSTYLFIDLIFGLKTNLDIKAKPEHRPRKVANNSAITQMVTTKPKIIESRPGFRSPIDEEQPEVKPNKTELNQIPQLEAGVGRGRKISNFLKLRDSKRNQFGDNH